jgi:hypothetical protein
LATKILSGEITTWKNYYHTDPSGKGFCGQWGGLFCLNLFPINFRRHNNSGWSYELQNITGFATKHHYRVWCVERRFPHLQELAVQYKPSVIVCPSASETRDDCITAFGRRGQELGYPIFCLPSTAKKDLPVYRLASHVQECVFWVVPFLGQGGIMADCQIQKLGEYIRDDIVRRTPERLTGFWPEVDSHGKT